MTMIAQALRDRLEMIESLIDLDNRSISRRRRGNALLPQVALDRLLRRDRAWRAWRIPHRVSYFERPDKSFGGAVR